MAETSLKSDLKITKEINISFENLCYTAKVGLFKRREKKILKNLNGEFRARELTAIMGPSGSGKSTLLDILSGYNTKNIDGNIKVNDSPREQKQFRHLSSYIMQENSLHPLLTVREAMKFSANLKTGNELSPQQKQQRINEILDLLGLNNMVDTYTGKLSGGQQKRLSIALELVDNPKIMFFDEPISGLDSSTSTQCIQLLKKLSENGRTIICTIHQPSSMLFRMFDHIYAIAEGQCIYSGDSTNLVPYLDEMGLRCPQSYNPADYLLEISTHDYGYQLDRLRDNMQNGLNNIYRKDSHVVSKLDDNVKTLITRVESNPISIYIKRTKLNSKLQIFDPKNCCNDRDLYSTGFLRQFYYLLIRTFLLISRNPSLTSMRLMIHLIVAIAMGVMYMNIGQSASNLMNNFRFIFFSVMFLMFTAFSSMQTTFPSELHIIRREHFNRWYSVRAYYVSLTLADVPIQVFCTMLYVCITYFLTDQKLELFRFCAYLAVNLLVCFVAQGLGLLAGSIFNIKWGAIFGPFFICPFLIFSGFFVQMKHAHAAMHWLFQISFLKYALQGSVYSILGFNREKLDCDAIYCHYRIPNQFIKDIGMLECSKNSTQICDQVSIYNEQRSGFWHVILILIVFIFVFRTCAYIIMSHRLKH